MSISSISSRSVNYLYLFVQRAKHRRRRHAAGIRIVDLWGRDDTKVKEARTYIGIYIPTWFTKFCHKPVNLVNYFLLTIKGGLCLIINRFTRVKTIRTPCGLNQVSETRLDVLNLPINLYPVSALAHIALGCNPGAL